MHPAPSLIVFTSLSGLGFGFLFWLGLGVAQPEGVTAFFVYALAFALAAGGLSASVFHLGHPERALLAFTQWRTSWLSREGVVAVATLVVMGLFAIGQIFFGVTLLPLGWLGALLCVVTVFCTAMIYASLKAVPRWHSRFTPALFVVYALTGGALFVGLFMVAAIGLLALTALQAMAWAHGDRALARSGTNLSTATGLGTRGQGTGPGQVRLFEPPHTGGNYLLHEMAFRVARGHRARLRMIAMIFLGLVPAVFLALAALFGWIDGDGAWLVAFFAILFHAVGLFSARWLFYAEAEHVQALYYGRHAEAYHEGVAPAR